MQRNHQEMLEFSKYRLTSSLSARSFLDNPTLFAQVYVIHGLRGGPNLSQDGHLLPCLFVLLPNKTQATYRRMWEQVQLLCPLAHPAEILMDFEKAAMTSFEHTWPTSMVKGCFFHLTQSLWRKVQAVGLQSQYSHDEEFANRIRQIAALAFASTRSICSVRSSSSTTSLS